MWWVDYLHNYMNFVPLNNRVIVPNISYFFVGQTLKLSGHCYCYHPNLKSKTSSLSPLSGINSCKLGDVWSKLMTLVTTQGTVA